MGTVHRGISFLSLTRVGGAGGNRRRLRTRPPVARRDARACGIANDAGPGRSPGLQADAIASSDPPSRAVDAFRGPAQLGWDFSPGRWTYRRPKVRLRRKPSGALRSAGIVQPTELG